MTDWASRPATNSERIKLAWAEWRYDTRPISGAALGGKAN